MSVLGEYAKMVMDAVVLIVLVYLGQSKTKEQFKKLLGKLLPHDIEIKKQIKYELLTLMLKVGAVRANLWQFNNGTKSLSNYSFKYASIIYETYHKNYHPIKDQFTNIPIEDFIDIIEPIQVSDKFHITDKNTGGAQIRSVYEQIGVTFGISYKLDNKEVYKGFISLTFSTKPDDIEDIIMEVETAAIRINSLIKKTQTK